MFDLTRLTDFCTFAPEPKANSRGCVCSARAKVVNLGAMRTEKIKRSKQYLMFESLLFVASSIAFD